MNQCYTAVTLATIIVAFSTVSCSSSIRIISEKSKKQKQENQGALNTQNQETQTGKEETGSKIYIYI